MNIIEEEKEFRVKESKAGEHELNKTPNSKIEKKFKSASKADDQRPKTSINSLSQSHTAEKPRSENPEEGDEL